jgi:sterol desaturase/sphingolipid hydroxylase (fatty acid hydroxylase superfamily)
LDLGARASSAGPVAAAAIAIVAIFVISAVSDFFYYWYHRMAHRWALLWRFHRIHHAISELSGWDSYSHIGDALFQIPLVALPATLLVHIDAGAAPLVVVGFLRVHGYLQHAATRLNFGVLRYVVADNRFHRLHHSIELRHHDKNFCNFTPLWDVLFGTACFPMPDDWPDVGLADLSEIRTLGDYAKAPVERL